MALLPDLYARADLEQFQRRLLGLLKQLLPDEGDLFRQQTTGALAPAELQPEHWVKIFNRPAAGHPLLRRDQQNPPGERVLEIPDVAPPRQFRRPGPDSDFFPPPGRPGQIAFTRRPKSAAGGGVAFNRDVKNFTEPERRLLTALRPHILTAYRNAKALTQQRNLMETCRHALDQSEAALVVLQKGRAALITRRAQLLLARYFPASRSGRALPDELLRHAARSNRTRSAAPDDGNARPSLVVRRGDGRLRIRLLPGRTAGERLLRLDEEPGCSPQQIQSLGLTAREAEVLSWLMRGKSNPEIGAIAGLTARTVEKHLEHVYAKLGVGNRVSATLQILQLLGGGRDGFDSIFQVRH